MTLAELQRSLAVSLMGTAPAPVGVNEGQIARARRALRVKRRRAAEAALPMVRRAMGAAWAARFDAHAAAYAPAGMLYHVDDAWALAESLAGMALLDVSAAARADLIQLRLRFVRDVRRDADRIRERRGPLVAIWPGERLVLMIRLPGRAGRVLRLPLGRARD